MAKKLIVKNNGSNPNVTAENAASIIAGLEKRKQQNQGALGINDAARLKDLKAKFPNASAGLVASGSTVANDINGKTGAITNPDDLLSKGGHTFDPNDPYWKTLYNNTYDNAYALGTKNLDSQQAKELENQKQELADRGIPYDPAAANDPNTKNQYGQAIGSINTKYQGLRDTASQQAYTAAQGVYGTQGGLANQGFAAYLQSALGISAADATAKAAEIQKYGIDEDTKAKLAAVEQSGKNASISAGASTTNAKIAASAALGGSGGFDVPSS